MSTGRDRSEGPGRRLERGPGIRKRQLVKVAKLPAAIRTLALPPSSRSLAARSPVPAGRPTVTCEGGYRWRRQFLGERPRGFRRPREDSHRIAVVSSKIDARAHVMRGCTSRRSFYGAA